MDNLMDNLMNNDGFHPIHPSARKVWMINGIIGSIFIMVIPIIAFLFLKHWLILAIPSLLCVYTILVHPWLEYKQWSYKITETSICYNHGIYTKKFTIIPVSRIQHLEIKQGPVLKHFGLSNVEIYTAGQAHSIVAVHTAEAEGIIDSINLIISKEDPDGKH